MRTLHNANSNSKIISLLIKFVLFFEIIKQISATPSGNDQELVSSSTALAIPDFFVDIIGQAITNPIIENTAKAPIALMDARLESKMSANDINKALSLCDEAIHEVLKENCWIARDQFIHDIHTQSLKIILTAPEALHDSSSIGSYSIQHQQIVIAHAPGLVKEDYKRAFLNELMSHLVVMSHKRCGIVTKTDKLLGVPFLKKDGTIDPSLEKIFKKSIVVGVARVKQINALWEKRKEKLSAAENNSLIQFLAAAKHYTPKTFHISLADLGGSNGLQKKVAAGIYREAEGYLEPGPHFPPGIPFFRGKKQGDHIIYHHTHNTQSAHGRIQAFLGDFEQITKAMEANHGPYANLPPQHKLTEFATFIGELPKPLLELFFPEFLSATKEYVSRCRGSSNAGTMAVSDALFKPPSHYAKQPRYEKTPPKPHANRDHPRKGKAPR